MSRLCLFFVGLLFGGTAFAGYRVHELKLTYYDTTGRIERVRFVLSNLDHLQYEHYNDGYRTVRVELVDTWYCPGDTSRRAYCKKPKEAAVRGPASTEPKRLVLPYNRQPIIP